jgi:acylphosphatase
LLLINFENVMPAIHLIIKGKVQGVYFRASAAREARQLGLTGWVRNTAEGDVEIIAQGGGDELKSFASWCHKGPKSARVTGVVQKDVDEQAFGEFSIQRR